MLSRGFGMNSYTARNPSYCIVPSETNLGLCDYDLNNWEPDAGLPEPQGAPGAGDDRREA